MTLHPPFFIGSRLLPSIKVGEATLSYDQDAAPDYVPVGCRFMRKMYMDFPNGAVYEDDTMQSPRKAGLVEVFHTYLSFLSACDEARYFNSRHPNTPSENSTLFPEWVMEAIGIDSDGICLIQEEISQAKDLIKE